MSSKGHTVLWRTFFTSPVSVKNFDDRNSNRNVINKFDRGCTKWDSRFWDSFSVIGGAHEILEKGQSYLDVLTTAPRHFQSWR